MAWSEHALDGSSFDPCDGIRVVDLGQIDYKTGLSVQRDLVEKKKKGLPDTVIIICEHFPVITYGRRACLDNLLTSIQTLRKFGIELSETNRGGDFTYHGPGMLVVYPILDLRAVDLDAISYLRFLERTIIELLANFNIHGLTVDGQTGVWVDPSANSVQNSVRGKNSAPISREVVYLDHEDYCNNGQHREKPKSGEGITRTHNCDIRFGEAVPVDLKKICSIGIRVERGVAYHGLCLNVIKKPPFGLEFINPCGLTSSKYVFMDELVEVNDFWVVKEVAISVFVKNFKKLKNPEVDCNGTLPAQKFEFNLFENLSNYGRK